MKLFCSLAVFFLFLVLTGCDRISTISLEVSASPQVALAMVTNAVERAGAVPTEDNYAGSLPGALKYVEKSTGVPGCVIDVIPKSEGSTLIRVFECKLGTYTPESAEEGIAHLQSFYLRLREQLPELPPVGDATIKQR
ncbi:MAG: hypothetical protein IT579_01125 [Verrucomicrobia subdivision 3 bacterium]|nr:hypothetical protein [Limisphaerales bacterium]